MKNQFVILVIAVVLLQLVSQSEAFLGALWSGIKSIFGKRGLRNLDQYDDLFDDDSFDDDLSAADLKALQELFR